MNDFANPSNINSPSHNSSSSFLIILPVLCIILYLMSLIMTFQLPIGKPVTPQAQDSNQDLEFGSPIFPCIPYDLATSSLLSLRLIRVKVLPTNQHESFQHALSSLTCILEKFSRRSPNIKLLQVKHA